MKLNVGKITIKQMLIYGVHRGYSKRYLNSQIKPYLLGFKNQFTIFNLKPIKYQLKSIIYLITEIIAKRQVILIVNHYKEALSLKNSLTFKRCFLLEGFWLGGFLTNFKIIKLYTNYREKNNKYLEFLRILPSFIFFINTTTDNWGLKESINLNIPMAIATGANFNLLNRTVYPVVASNETTEAQSFYAHLIKGAVIKGFQKEKLKILALRKLKK